MALASQRSNDTEVHEVGSTLYADLKFTPDPQNAGENNVKNPGNDVSGIPSSGSNVQPSTALGSSVCGTRFEVQCQEVNPRHAFEELTNAYEWVDYNKSSYKFVAKYDYESTSGSPSCWGDSSNWGPDNAQFFADAVLPRMERRRTRKSVTCSWNRRAMKVNPPPEGLSTAWWSLRSSPCTNLTDDPPSKKIRLGRGVTTRSPCPISGPRRRARLNSP